MAASPARLVVDPRGADLGLPSPAPQARDPRHRGSDHSRSRPGQRGGRRDDRHAQRQRPPDAADVSETLDRPRRLVLDFPNVSSTARSQTAVDGPLVKRVRVAQNSREPLVTRVVMEVPTAATYHVERAGPTAAISRWSSSRRRPPGRSWWRRTGRRDAARAGARHSAARGDRQRGVDHAEVGRAAFAPHVRSLRRARAGRSDRGAQARAREGLARAGAGAAPARRRRPQPRRAAGAAPYPAGNTQQQLIAGTTEKQYTGHPINLDFEDADLRSVLRFFNETAG